MKSSLLCTLFMFLLLDLSAQKEYNIWYFGTCAGLDFNGAKVRSFYDSSFFTFESSTSMCDTNGKLLFYSNGNFVYNRFGDTMPNSKFKWRHYSAMQGSMALPVPGSRYLYYLILGSEIESTGTTGIVDSLRVAVIDMRAENGKGAVITKELPLLPRALEAFAVARHANGVDYWIAAPEHHRKCFNCIRTENGGFANQFVSNPVPNGDSLYPSNSKFSPNSKIVLTNYVVEGEGAVKKVSVNLYRFDNATGLISQKIQLRLGDLWGIPSFEFSPNSQFLYIKQINKPPSASIVRLLTQYDLSVWDSATIVNSKKNISGIFGQGQGMQLGPDGRLYIFPSGYYSGNRTVYCLQYPDKPYPYCLGKDSVIELVKSANALGCPYYPGFYFEVPRIDLDTSQYVCGVNSLTLSAKIEGADSFRWEGGSVNQDYVVSKAGKYRIRAYLRGRVFLDSVQVQWKPQSVYYLDNAVMLCNMPQQLTFQGNADLLWSTGETTNTIQVDDTGTFHLDISMDGCQYKEDVKVTPCFDMFCFVPDAFSPDASLLNDSIGLECQHINGCKMRIYNRWGELVFECNEIGCSWDGYFNGQACPAGVYMMYAEVTGMEGLKPHLQQIRRTVHLMR